MRIFKAFAWAVIWGTESAWEEYDNGYGMKIKWGWLNRVFLWADL